MLNVYHAKSIYLQSAALSGLKISEKSPTALANLVDRAYRNINENRRPVAVANMLKVIAVQIPLPTVLKVVDSCLLVFYVKYLNYR